MKGKLGIFLGVLCVVSFILYQIGESNRKDLGKEILLNGKVVDIRNQEPIKGVTIAISGSNPKTLTDDNGDFTILVKSNDELIFKHSDYKSVIIFAKDARNIQMELKE